MPEGNPKNFDVKLNTTGREITFVIGTQKERGHIICEYLDPDNVRCFLVRLVTGTQSIVRVVQISQTWWFGWVD